jgi:hypothetical protein
VQPYSPERRTALVLCGTGAHGAYHAGVLRALQEAGVKIDVMAGHGAGAAAAALAAIDGAGRLSDKGGIWRGETASGLYRIRLPLRAAGWVACALLAVIVAPLVLTPLGFAGAPMFWTTTALLLAIIFLWLIAAGGWLDERRSPARRRADGQAWWRLLGAPLDARAARAAFADALWQLIRGASPEAQSTGTAIGRRYSELLAENLGQPGFRELMIVATDIDSQRDVVGALLSEPHRREFGAPRPGVERRAEAVDLAGTGSDHAFDLVAAALTPPVICDPYLLTFGIESFWRGETHRLCDRPAACSRLLDELAWAGVSQAIVVSGVATARAPHRLRSARLDIRHRLGDFLAAAEAAALRDAMEMARLRFDSIYLIAPAHNPVGPFDLGGAYDEASDRRQDLTELMGRAYEDAYHQFIEPVVGASGDRLARSS